MLSNRERQEILEDALNTERREEFRRSREVKSSSSRILDEYIKFLMDIQKVFTPFVPSEKKTITRVNKL